MLLPINAEELFKQASIHDSRGEEELAVDLYRAIYDSRLNELSPALRPRLLVQYGSTLRNLGRLGESIKVLEKAVHQFPGYAPAKAFLLLTEQVQGANREIVIASLAKALESPTELDGYDKALRFYLAELMK